MKSLKCWALGISALAAVSLPVAAALETGDKAPDFSAQASLGGEVTTFKLSEALKKGPVVLYFFPAAFTSGCTVEAHDFAEATEAYRKLGATVVGISHDTIDVLNKFSVSECRKKFVVAADPDLTVAKAYDAVLFLPMFGHSNRTSYVIAPDSTIIYGYKDLSPDKHVANTLAALKTWEDQHPGAVAPTS